MKIGVKSSWMKELRLHRGWTQEELAALAGLHTRTIQRIEKEGLAAPNSLNAIAQALEIDREEMQQTLARPVPENSAIQGQQLRQPRFRRFNREPFNKQWEREMERSKRWASNEWIAWCILFLGGILSVVVMLQTQANLSRDVLFNVFFPGLAIGTVLMLSGSVGVYLSTRAREQMTLIRRARRAKGQLNS